MVETRRSVCPGCVYSIAIFSSHFLCVCGPTSPDPVGQHDQEGTAQPGSGAAEDAGGADAHALAATIPSPDVASEAVEAETPVVWPLR
jgi:hypothetical protein